jgi:hypothetical protein
VGKGVVKDKSPEININLLDETQGKIKRKGSDFIDRRSMMQLKLIQNNGDISRVSTNLRKFGKQNTIKEEEGMTPTNSQNMTNSAMSP